MLLTEDVEESVRFLAEVVGMGEPRWFPSHGEQAARLFRWPEGTEDARRAVLGTPPGLVEVVEIPGSLRGSVRPGLAFVGFATPDVADVADRSRAAGFLTGDVLEFEGTSLVEVQTGGVTFGLLRFA